MVKFKTIVGRHESKNEMKRKKEEKRLVYTKAKIKEKGENKRLFLILDLKWKKHHFLQLEFFFIVTANKSIWRKVNRKNIKECFDYFDHVLLY